MKYTTGEEWLNEGLILIRPLFKEIGQKVPARVRVSCGFPSRNPFGKKRRIGECWSDKASAGKVFEIFVSPVLNTLVHEAVHAIVGLEAGHKTPFKRVALAVGLTGKMTATVAGPALLERINAITVKLGCYPHDELSRMTNNAPKDKCRLIKASCPDCGYVIRTTRKWIEEAGLPTCPCGGEFVEA